MGEGTLGERHSGRTVSGSGAKHFFGRTDCHSLISRFYFPQRCKRSPEKFIAFLVSGFSFVSLEYKKQTIKISAAWPRFLAVVLLCLRHSQCRKQSPPCIMTVLEILYNRSQFCLSTMYMYMCFS